MKVPDKHLTALLRYFQADSRALTVDGRYGPLTAAELDDYLDDNEVTAVRASTTLPTIERAFDSALAEKGMAEVPLGSNTGLYLEDMRLELDLPQRGQGEWCGLFQSAHATRAGIDAKSRTARGFIRAVEALPGGREVPIAAVTPGFYGYALKRRGEANHHIQIFHCFEVGEDTLIQHVGGNEGHRVKSKTWSFDKYFSDCLQVVTYED